jgi:nucleolar protein TMA23
MDAHAHLLSLGWAGPGHALDSRPSKTYKQQGKRGLDYDPKQLATNTGVGLVKPLMVSQRKDRFGIGKKDPKHEPAAGNEWWLKGFETALSNIGKSESERSGTATPVQALVNGQKHQGLYGFFVKGQQMEGTIGQEMLRRSKKRKSDQISKDSSDDDQENGKMSGDGINDFVQAATFMAIRDKDEKRRRKVDKTGAMEEFQQATQFFEARSQKKEEKKRKGQAEPDTADGSEVGEVGGPVHEETKEERRERRRKRKEEKAARMASVAQEDRDLPLSPSDDTSKRKPKGERRRRREGHV